MMMGEQVDDNGESYWIFESRDVRGHIFQSSLLRAKHSPSSLHGPPILSILGECLAMHSRLPISDLMLPSRLFWTALYVFPALWLGLFFVSLLKFNLS